MPTLGALFYLVHTFTFLFKSHDRLTFADRLQTSIWLFEVQIGVLQACGHEAHCQKAID